MTTSQVVWGLPTRLLHWGLAICVVLNLFILEEGDAPHEWTGYIAVAFVALRFLIGVRGNHHARFKNFPIRPQAIYQFLVSEIKGRPDDYQGHNPLASLVYFVIWLLIIALGITGYMMDLDAFWGEEWLENLHSNLSDSVMVLVGLHLIGIALDSYKFKRKTWLGMIHGRKG